MNLLIVMIRSGSGDYPHFWSQVRNTVMLTYSKTNKDLLFIMLSISGLDQLNKTSQLMLHVQF